MVKLLKNLTAALDGCPRFRNGNAERILNSLCACQVLYKTKINRNEVYNAMVSNFSDDKFEAQKKDIVETKTEAFIDERLMDKMENNISLPSELANRYGSMPEFLTVDTFRVRMDRLNAEKAVYSNRIEWAMTIAKDDGESDVLRQMIHDYYAKNKECSVVVVETCGTAFGMDALDLYADSKARAEMHKASDKGQSQHFDKEAETILGQWYERIRNGEFMVYSSSNTKGERAQTKDQMQTTLRKIIRERYPLALELSFKTSDTVWNGNSSLKVGAKCGLFRKLTGCFTTNKKNSETNLEYQLRDIWNISEYWDSSPKLETEITICEMKNALNDKVNRVFDQEGRISMREIVEMFQEAPYGLTFCNLSAFVLGFLLKEYVDGAYTWSDGTTSDSMTEDKLAQMVDGAMKYIDNPSARYRDEYIVRDKEEIRQFADSLMYVFDINRESCGNLDSARGVLRSRMKKYEFPIWCLKSNLANEKLDSSVRAVSEIIDRYVQFANNTGLIGSDNDIAEDLGRRYMMNKREFSDLKKLVKQAKIRAGMTAYAASYRDGALPHIAESVGDMTEEYIVSLKNKFDASDANWVWREETVQQKIDELILEYEIVAKSRGFVPQTSKFDETMKYWKDKCAELFVPYQACKDRFESDMARFLEILYELGKKDGMQARNLSVEDIREFGSLLDSQGDRIRAFFEPEQQKGLYQAVLNLRSPEYSDEDVEDILEMASKKNVWTDDVLDWENESRSKIKAWKRNNARSRLLTLWSDKTGTDTPTDWSNKYQTPILLMFEDHERDEARKHFSILNDESAGSDESKIQAAMEFIEHASFYEKLGDESLRDSLFREKILEDYQYILKDIQKIRGELMKVESVYRWLDSSKVRSKVKELGESEYEHSGFEDANRVVDSMEAEELKRYLKELIRSNAKVGIEIIRHH